MNTKLWTLENDKIQEIKEKIIDYFHMSDNLFKHK